MDMYRTFVSVKGSPELWVIDVETDQLYGIAYGIKEYMSNFKVDWEIISVNKIDLKKIDVYIEDINLN